MAPCAWVLWKGEKLRVLMWQKVPGHMSWMLPGASLIRTLISFMRRGAFMTYLFLKALPLSTIVLGTFEFWRWHNSRGGSDMGSKCLKVKLCSYRRNWIKMKFCSFLEWLVQSLTSAIDRIMMFQVFPLCLSSLGDFLIELVEVQAQFSCLAFWLPVVALALQYWFTF